MQIEIMTNGPITVGMNVYMDLFTYEDGIYSHVTGDFAGGHAVYIVGWGEREGVKYWIVVNSWSDAWAQNGTFKILRGQNECGIETGYKPVAPKIEVVTN
jgi:cathepsin B